MNSDQDNNTLNEDHTQMFNQFVNVYKELDKNGIQCQLTEESLLIKISNTQHWKRISQYLGDLPQVNFHYSTDTTILVISRPVLNADPETIRHLFPLATVHEIEHLLPESPPPATIHNIDHWLPDENSDIPWLYQCVMCDIKSSPDADLEPPLKNRLPESAFHCLCTHRECMYCDECAIDILQNQIFTNAVLACAPRPGALKVFNLEGIPCVGSECTGHIPLSHWNKVVQKCKTKELFTIVDLPPHRDLTPAVFWRRIQSVLHKRSASTPMSWPSYCPACAHFQIMNRDREHEVVSSCQSCGVLYCTTCCLQSTMRRFSAEFKQAHQLQCYRAELHALYAPAADTMTPIPQQPMPEVPPLLARAFQLPGASPLDSFSFDQQVSLQIETRQYIEQLIEYAAYPRCPQPTCRQLLSKFQEKGSASCNYLECYHCGTGVCWCCGREVVTHRRQYLERLADQDGTLAFLAFEGSAEPYPAHVSIGHEGHCSNRYVPGNLWSDNTARYPHGRANALSVRPEWNELWRSVYGPINTYTTDTADSIPLNIHIPAPTLLTRVCPFNMSTVLGSNGWYYEYSHHELPDTVTHRSMRTKKLTEEEAGAVFQQLRTAEFLVRCVRGFFEAHRRVDLFLQAVQDIWCVSSAVVHDNRHLLARLQIRPSMASSASTAVVTAAPPSHKRKKQHSSTTTVVKLRRSKAGQITMIF